MAVLVLLSGFTACEEEDDSLDAAALESGSIEVDMRLSSQGRTRPPRGQPRPTGTVPPAPGSPSAPAPVGGSGGPIVAIGDSITAGYGCSSSWPGILSAIIGQGVSNQGVGGIATAQGVALTAQVVSGMRPSTVMILLGTNDVNGGGNTSAAANNIASMIYIARSAGARVIVGTIPPFVGPVAGKNASVVSLNSKIVGVAAASGAAVADVYGAFGNNPSLMQSDGFHPNDSGQQVIASVFGSRF
jgi:lysophospholipase L1-like esterase